MDLSSEDTTGAPDDSTVNLPVTYPKPAGGQPPRWNVRGLTTSAVAELLGVNANSVRTNLSRDSPLPPPAESGARNVWTEAQIYEYMRANPRRKHHPVPRLYPGPTTPAPARFIAAEPFALLDKAGRAVELAVHLWEPSDDRGNIAIGYLGPLNSTPYGPYTIPETWAARLLEAYPSSYTSAVLVLDHERQHTSGIVIEPRIAVADRPVEDRARPPAPLDARGPCSHTVRGGPATATWTDLSWVELQHLLQVDVPWWPPERLASTTPLGDYEGHTRRALDPILQWTRAECGEPATTNGGGIINEYASPWPS